MGVWVCLVRFEQILMVRTVAITDDPDESFDGEWRGARDARRPEERPVRGSEAVLV